jgi:uncharacterized membrane protein
MKTTTLAIATALAGAIAAPALLAGGAAAQSGPAPKPDFKFEKCYGVVKAGHNDCQTANSSCAGTSKRDMQADAWLYVPAGVCSKIAGGSPEPKKS